ncbi:SDR family NAD(P)-dependent oxidoreductase [Promicromonospora sukumoe]
MNGKLDGTVALVTGASSGIGEATARALARQGAAVALVARRRDRLEAVAESIRSDGGTALEIEADITDGAAAQDAVERTVEALGRLDTLVNNAGLMLIGPFAQAPADEWDRMLAINVQGLLRITQAAQPHLVRAAEDTPRQVADIVNISSTAGRVANAGNAVYSLTKFGVVAFTEALRKELLPQRVRVSVVEPGTVDTELGTHVRAELQEAIARQTAGLEKLLPEDIADAITYIVTRDRRVAVNEMLVRAGAQTW